MQSNKNIALGQRKTTSVMHDKIVNEVDEELCNVVS